VCAFSRDGAELYCVRRPTGAVGPSLTEGQDAVLFARPLAGGPERIITTLSANQIPQSDLFPALKMTLAPDGQHLTFSAREVGSNLWLLDGIGPLR
jgi:hypothetical protein